MLKHRGSHCGTYFGLSIVVMVSMTFGWVTPSAAAHSSFDRNTQQAAAEPGPTPFVVRTRVQVHTPAQWRDLERLGVVVLESGDDWALVLADDVQLESLARWRFNPDQTNTLDSLMQGDAMLVDNIKAMSTQLVSRASLRAAMMKLDARQRINLIEAANVDGDNDGLTDTQEGYLVYRPGQSR